jgi:transglutaminase-like putative cysteine protease
VRFNFVIGGSKSSLLYAPAQPVWFSRPGSYLAISNDATKDITSWHSSPALLPGETYQAEAILNNPHVEELRQAGAQYPSWITEKYLQIPENFSPRIQTLAQDITLNASTPYDKTVAITNYLRANIEYAPTIPELPRNSDPLEWVLFEYKQAYCVYYATAEVMMLRSLGIPARMAVGFAQGTRVVDEQPGEVEDTATDSFTVQKKNAHAWPEVYFPDIGWVEFEPTGNQSPLDRPLLARESNDLNNNGLIRNLPLAEDELTNRDPGLDESTSTSTGQSTRIPPSLYLILILIFFTPLTIYLARRYNVPARVPVLIRSTMQRNGIDVPDWIIRWENWSGLSVVERSFESVNFGLRRVKQPAPIYATPAERAQKLSSILPNLEPQIKVLLDEHQTSLYTSRVADEKKARRAANQIRMQVVISLLRHLLTGQYETPAK